MYVLLGEKKEMTQVFAEDWGQTPVTVLDAKSAVVAKKKDDKIWVGFGKKKSAGNQEAGQFKKLGYVPQKVIEVPAKSLEEYKGLKVGDKLPLKGLVGAKARITGVSKGKGFAGVYKRFDVKGGPETHGQKDTQRHVGSIGAQTPGKVWPGQKMPGRKGTGTTTILNSEVVFVDEKEGIIAVKGGVPGGRGSIVQIAVEERPNEYDS